MCRWRHVKNVFLRCGHAESLPSVEFKCESTRCKFSPNHPALCVPPSCAQTCIQYHLFPEPYTPTIDGYCPACMRYRTHSEIHFKEFDRYLAAYLAKAPPDHRSKFRQELIPLTMHQFHELSTDVYDDVIRRENEEVPTLPIHEDFHPNRIQERQKIAALTVSLFEDLASDIHFDLGRRYPEFKEDNVSSTSVQVKESDSLAPRLRNLPSGSPAPMVSPPSLPLDVAESNVSMPVELNQPSIEISHIYLTSIFVYHIVLLRIPAMYAALASDTFDLHSCDSDSCALDLWAAFTGILLKQWKTLSLLSTLIFGATLAMLQIPSITSSPLLRVVVHGTLLYSIMSLILMSLLGICFGSFRTSGGAERWVQEMRTAMLNTHWNFWVLISLPVVWTCWAVFLFLNSMVLFVWPPGGHDLSDDSPNEVQEPIGAKVFLSIVMFDGVVHLALAVSKLIRVCNAAGTPN